MSRLEERYAAERPELPHPLEPPAIVDRYYDCALVECCECDRPLTAREYQPDYDGDSEGWRFCGRDWCDDCIEEHEASRARAKAVWLNHLGGGR